VEPKRIAREWIEVWLGHKVIVSRADLGKAWRDQVNPRPGIPDKVSDVSGACYDSAFNDFCKALGLDEGK
jgi:hypothetical protein